MKVHHHVLTGVALVLSADALALTSKSSAAAPSKYTVTAVGLSVHGLSDEDVARRRSVPHHMTHMRRRDSHFPDMDTSIEEHAQDISVGFEWEGDTISLRCQRNEKLIPSDFHIVDGDVTLWGTERCYYSCEGSNGSDGMKGTLTTCGQFRGIFESPDGDELILGPVDDAIDAMEGGEAVADYYIYRRSDSPADQPADNFCGGVKHADGTVTNHPHPGNDHHDHHHHHAGKKPKGSAPAKSKRRALTSKRDKYVGLLIGVGPGFIEYHDYRRNAPGAEVMTLTIMNSVQAAYSADVFDYDIFVTINEIQYYRNYEQNCGNSNDFPLPCDLDTSPENGWNFITASGDVLLEHWSAYVKANNRGSDNSQRWDSAQFLGAYDRFGERQQGGTIGYAYVGTTCEQYSAGINEVLRESDWTTVAHELGHNLGSEHDSDGNSCPGTGYIMAASKGAIGREFWSDCTIDQFNTFIGREQCLDTDQGIDQGIEVSRYKKLPASTYGACSVRDGCGLGTRTQTVVCVDTETNNRVVADRFCENLNNPKLGTQACSQTRRCAAVAGPYGQCSNSCGRGVETETVTCINRNTGTTVDSLLCDGLPNPTLSQRPCTDESGCRTFAKELGYWENCNQICRNTYGRKILCTETTPESDECGAVVDPSFCNGLPDPADNTQYACKKPNQQCTFQKVLGDGFGECVAPGGCGRGVRYQSIDCIGTLNGQAWKTSPSFCFGPNPDVTDSDTTECFSTGRGCDCVDAIAGCNLSRCGTASYDEFCGATCGTCGAAVCEDDPSWRDDKGKGCDRLKTKDCYKCKKGFCGYVGCPATCGVC